MERVPFQVFLTEQVWEFHEIKTFFPCPGQAILFFWFAVLWWNITHVQKNKESLNKQPENLW